VYDVREAPSGRKPQVTKVVGQALRANTAFVQDFRSERTCPTSDMKLGVQEGCSLSKTNLLELSNTSQEDTAGRRRARSLRSSPDLVVSC
jgi:hypothetical protein